MNEDELVSQCIFFLIAGFETTASTLTCALFELTHNQDVQDRLVDEIVQAGVVDMDPNSGEFYETVMTKIPYLEACVKASIKRYFSYKLFSKNNPILIGTGNLAQVSARDTTGTTFGQARLQTGRH